MKLLRHAYFFCLFLVCLFAQSFLNATGLSPRAFKNVNQCFKPGYEYYSPIFGSAALSCGIIENLRFYNIEATTYDKDGKREYIKDKALNDDPIMEIIKILFPSPAGLLTTETTADTSFGKFCTKPEQIAALLNFSYAIRNYYQNKKAAPLSQDISKLLKKISQTDVIASNFPDDPFKNANKKKLLTNIAKAIAAEKAPLKAGAAPAFYPAYFVEQVITAFFCHKFADQQNIKDLLNALNDTIVDKNKINHINGLLEKEDVDPALGNIEKPATLDDLWIIINRDIFTRRISYKSGVTPISNASAKFYQRSTDKLSNATFADCVEVTLRHIINFMVYDPAATNFNTASLDAHMNGKDTTYIKNLKEFYTVQPPDKANAGDLAIRSAWNKVVADLGHDVVYWQKFDPADAHNNNELDSGMLNLVRVFKTIFALEIDNEPTLVAGQETVFQENVQKLVTDCLQKLCTVLHSGHSCEVDYNDVTIDSSRNDLLGNIEVKVGDKSAHLFGFTIRVLNMHIDIQNLNISQKYSVILNNEQIQKVSGMLMGGYERTPRPSLLLLDEVFLKDISTISCLYQLFNKPVNDTNSIIKTLTILHDNKDIMKDQALIILQNLLHAFQWDDKHSRKEIVPILKKLRSVDAFKKIIEQETKNIIIDQSDFARLPTSTTELSDTSVDWYIDHVDLDLSTFSKLKKINFNFTHLASIKLPENSEDLTSVVIKNSKLNELNLSGAVNLNSIFLNRAGHLETITFPPKTDHLKTIDIQFSNLKELNLSGAVNLNSIFLKHVDHLETITFPPKAEHLETIDIQYSELTKIDLSGGLNLRTINLQWNVKLEKLILPQQVQKIEIWNSKLNEIDLSKTLNITEINFNTNKELEKIIWPGTMHNLQKINIRDAKIKKLNLVECPTLIEMSLIYITDLTSINISGSMPNLKTLKIDQCSNMKTISGFKFCPQLKKEDFPGITILDEPEITESPLDQLRKSLEALKSKLAFLANNLADLSTKK